MDNLKNCWLINIRTEREGERDRERERERESDALCYLLDYDPVYIG